MYSRVNCIVDFNLFCREYVFGQKIYKSQCIVDFNLFCREYVFGQKIYKSQCNNSTWKGWEGKTKLNLNQTLTPAVYVTRYHTKRVRKYWKCLKISTKNLKNQIFIISKTPFFCKRYVICRTLQRKIFIDGHFFYMTLQTIGQFTERHFSTHPPSCCCIPCKTDQNGKVLRRHLYHVSFYRNIHCKDWED